MPIINFYRLKLKRKLNNLKTTKILTIPWVTGGRVVAEKAPEHKPQDANSSENVKDCLPANILCQHARSDDADDVANLSAWLGKARSCYILVRALILGLQ